MYMYISIAFKGFLNLKNTYKINTYCLQQLTINYKDNINTHSNNIKQQFTISAKRMHVYFK